MSLFSTIILAYGIILLFLESRLFVEMAETGKSPVIKNYGEAVFHWVLYRITMIWMVAGLFSEVFYKHVAAYSIIELAGMMLYDKARMKYSLLIAPVTMAVLLLMVFSAAKI